MSLTPKNWATFQHYKDRKPAWIKLHHELLDDYQFSCLPVASRALAPCLWLLASEYEGGEITAPLEEIAFRLRMSLDDLCKAIGPLVESKFFILSNAVAISKQDASDLLAAAELPASLEKEGERQVTSKRERKKEPATLTLLPDTWLPSEVHFDLAKAIGLSRQQVEDAAREMRDWSLGNAEKRAKWDSVFNNWLRRDRKKQNGHGRQGSLQDDRSISRAAGRLAEAARRGEYELAPRPSLLPRTDENIVQLLPQRRGE